MLMTVTSQMVIFEYVRITTAGAQYTITTMPSCGFEK